MLLKTFPKRFYAVLAPSHSAVVYSRKGEQVTSAPVPIKKVTKTSCGVSVATIDQLGPLSSLALVINAGSRHETADTLGAAHMWKNTFIRTIPGDTVVRTIRENELRGDSLYTAVTRENLVIASDFLRDDLIDVVPEIASNFLNRAMESYEFLDARGQVLNESEFAMSSTVNVAIENLHAAAFRQGLGNSVFASEGNASLLKRADLMSFAEKWFVPERIAVVGRDVHHQNLVELVEAAFASLKASSASTVAASKYYGGERRVDTGVASPAEYFVAFPSSAHSTPTHPVSLVLRALLDGSRRIKWGSSASGLLSSTSVEASVRAFNTSYSDAGLFGIHVSAASTVPVKSAVQSSLDILKSLATTAVEEKDISRAKKTAIVDLEESGSRESSLIAMATQLFATKSLSDSKEIAEAVSKVSVQDLQKFVKSLLSAKPTVSTVGSSTLPYLDEFKF